MEWLRAGHMPYALPRDPARGEHIDGHQIAFTQFFSENGGCILLEEVSQLKVSVDDRAIREGSDCWKRVMPSLLATTVDCAGDAISGIAKQLCATMRGNFGERKRETD